MASRLVTTVLSTPYDVLANLSKSLLEVSLGHSGVYEEEDEEVAEELDKELAAPYAQGTSL
jgi:hypothetical protein